jgi:D-xylose 1-dehydrogenase
MTAKPFNIWVGPNNVRVNSILPGWIMTQRQQDLWLTPEGEAELMQRQCLKRKLIPDDIARVGPLLRRRRQRRLH